MKVDLKLKEFQNKARALLNKVTAHASFATLIIVLLVYIMVVWQMSRLSTAEPSSADEAAAATQIPKVDQKAINQIQALEQSNTQIHSLFNQARNNPFQE